MPPVMSDALSSALAKDPRLRAVVSPATAGLRRVAPAPHTAVGPRVDAPLELLTRAAVVRTARPECELVVTAACGFGARGWRPGRARPEATSHPP